MKPTAFLINVARGPIVDEPRSTRRSGQQIRAAATDVFEQEPTSADDPILALPNVDRRPARARLDRRARPRLTARGRGRPSWRWREAQPRRIVVDRKRSTTRDSGGSWRKGDGP